MRLKSSLIRALAALSLAFASPAFADAITIFSGGAVKAGLEVAAARYEREKGIKVSIEFHPMGPLTKLLASGAKPDLVVVTEDVWANTLKQGFVDAGTRTEVGRVGIGVAVHESAPSPDISTPEALKAALLKHDEISFDSLSFRDSWRILWA
jgi:molybdate transport system substrate-binding protein